MTGGPYHRHTIRWLSDVDREVCPDHRGCRGGDLFDWGPMWFFVLEALGERWAEDLGSDDYYLPNYFDYEPEAERWKYFRISTSSHNVLSFSKVNTIFSRFQKISIREFHIWD